MNKLMNPDTHGTTGIVVVSLISGLFLALAAIGLPQDPALELVALILGAIATPLAAIFVLNPRAGRKSCRACGHIRDSHGDGTCPVCAGDRLSRDHRIAAFRSRRWTGADLIDKSASSRWYDNCGVSRLFSRPAFSGTLGSDLFVSARHNRVP